MSHVHPVIVRHGRKLPIDVLQVFRHGFNTGEIVRSPNILGDLHLCLAGDLWADVIDRQTFDRRLRHRGQDHADNATHGRADPIHFGHTQTRDQGVHVGVILQIIVAVFRDMVAVASADNVRTNNAIVGAQFRRKVVKVAGISGQSMHAEKSFLMLELGHVTPFEVVDPVEAVKPEAQMIML